MLATLCGQEPWSPGAWHTVSEDIDIHVFLRAEIGHSLSVRMGEGTETRTEYLNDLTDRVWNLLRRSRTMPDGDAHTDDTKTEIGIDALLLARFLADPGREEVGT